MEKWLPIPGFENCGEVSSFGRIRSRDGFIRKTVIGNNGYERVGLKALSTSNTNYVTVHRLVAKVFVGGYADGLTVNHKDGVKTNNVADNLEWVSHSENVKHAYALGLRSKNHRKPKIPHDDFPAILSGLANGMTYRALAAQYDVCVMSMYNFVKRKTNGSHALRKQAA